MPFKFKQQELTLEGGFLNWGFQVIVVPKLQTRVLEQLHLDLPGMSQMKSLAQSYTWWLGLDKAIEMLSKSCINCQSVNVSPPAAPLPHEYVPQSHGSISTIILLAHSWGECSYSLYTQAPNGQKWWRCQTFLWRRVFLLFDLCLPLMVYHAMWSLTIAHSVGHSNLQIS